MDKESRIELRINAELKKRLKKFCKNKGLNLSETVRDAINNYINNKALVYVLIENLQNTEFYDSFKAFYTNLPDSVRESFDQMLGPEEEEVVRKTPTQVLKNVKVITQRGQEALNRVSIP